MNVNSTQSPNAAKKWTVLLWSASDNNLYNNLQGDIDEAETVGSTPQMDVVVQTSHAPVGGTVQRMKLEKNRQPGVSSPVLQDLGDVNMGSGAALSDFVQWGMKNFPAEHFMLIVSDHGSSWRGACQDDKHNGWMTLPDMEAGLKDAREKTGRKLDVLGFDACLMGNLEVAHQLKDECNYMVGSEEVEGGAGWGYNRVLSKSMLHGADTAMCSRLDFSPKQMAINVVTMAQGKQEDLATMTAIDMSKVGAISTAMNGFREAIVNSSATTLDLTEAAGNSQSFRHNYDLGDFASKVGESIGPYDPRLAAAAEAVKSALGDAVIAEQHSTKYPGAHGLSIQLEKPSRAQVDPRAKVPFGSYANTRFEQDVHWSDAIRRIQG